MQFTKLLMMALVAAVALFTVSAEAACDATNTDLVTCVSSVNLTSLFTLAFDPNTTTDDLCTAFSDLVTEELACYKDAGCSSYISSGCTQEASAYASLNCTLDCSSITAGLTGGVEMLAAGVVSSVVTVAVGMKML